MKMFRSFPFLFLICSGPVLLAQPIAPVDAKGHRLNLDFEDGTLNDWTATGQALEKQPVHGDTVVKRRADLKSEHQGEFWIGTYENSGDDLRGTLTSAPFKVTHPWASFLVGGGDGEGVRVELVDEKRDKVFYKISGQQVENMRPVVVEMGKEMGRKIFIRVVDEQKGPWGHINFDDFKFYAERPNFKNELTPKKAAAIPETDKVLYEGLSPEDAVTKMTLPPGFKATLFAGEPDVKQPIAFAIDHRGRLWVAEAYTYPKRAPEGEGKDRILVFEDTDGDGKFNKRTVFMEGLNLVSGIELGFGGVYVGAAPYLMFIPIADGDEPKPAGKPEILLDGWDYKRDTHETLNSFKWGPDGWLYGSHGVFCPSLVGKPGAPEKERQWVDAAIWRYHPTKKVFEVFAEGTSNPWGFDFDEHGQLFEEACVIPHLFHMIQGGRYMRQGGEHYTVGADETARNEKSRERNSRKTIFPYFYDDLKTIADHVHYAGDKGPHAGNGRSDSAGGGHAHAGLMVYQGNNWPEEYRGKIFIGNIHGQRINMDIPERKGSGFIGHHGKDPINFNDRWSQVINFQTGPDGAVYFIDWYDKNQCHHNNEAGHDRSNGRIFKISYGDTKFQKVDLQKLSDGELVKLLASKNNWQVRHAQEILQERYGNRDGKDRAQKLSQRNQPAKQLASNINSKSDQLLRLNSYQALGRIDGLVLPFEKRMLSDSDEHIRAWTIQFLCEEKTVSPEILKEFSRLAREDKSPIVRLYLASALQRLPLENRWDILANLYPHSEDASDPNLPLMYWYAAEPLAALDAKRALQIAETTTLPNILNFTVRRVAAIGTADAMAEIVASLKRQSSAERTLNILNGLGISLKGQRSAPMPRGWEEIETKLSENPNAEIRAQMQSLSLTFGSIQALVGLRKTLVNPAAEPSARRTALESLLNFKDKELAPALQSLLNDPALRGQALRGLALYEDSATPAKIITGYNSFNSEEKRDALNTLSSRVTFAKPLLVSVGADQISRKDLSADLVRQLRSLKNDEVNQQLEKVWGAFRESSADKVQQIEKYRKTYRAGGSQSGDASRGRAVFAKTCQQCHTLFDVGGKVGPDLTGSNRGDLSYILQNMVDPNAVIPNEYRASTLETKDDRVITGIVKTQGDNAYLVLTANEAITVPKNAVRSLKQNELSMMPEGLLDALSAQEVRDLIYYLGRPGQVPLAAPVAK